MPVTNQRIAHVRRINATDGSGNPVPGVWIDVLRIDHLRTTANPDLGTDGIAGQEYDLNFVWADDQIDPSGGDQSNASRVLETINIPFPDGSSEGNNQVNLSVIKQLTVTGWGHDIQAQGLTWNFLNTDGDGTQDTTRKATAFDVTYNDLGGDDGGDFITMPWDTYLTLLQDGSNPSPDQVISTEISDQISFTSQPTTQGILGSGLTLNLQNGPVKALFSPSDLSTTTNIVRTDPLQIIVNIKLGTAKVGLLQYVGGDNIRFTVQGYDPFNPPLGSGFPSKPQGPAGDTGIDGGLDPLAFTDTTGPPNPPIVLEPNVNFFIDNEIPSSSPTDVYRVQTGYSVLSYDPYGSNGPSMAAYLADVTFAYSDKQMLGYPPGSEGHEDEYTVRTIDTGLKLCGTSSGKVLGPDGEMHDENVSSYARLIYGQTLEATGELTSDGGPQVTFVAFFALSFGTGSGTTLNPNPDQSWFAITGTDEGDPDPPTSTTWIFPDPDATKALAMATPCGYPPGPVSETNMPLQNWPLTPPPAELDTVYALSSTDLAVQKSVALPPPLPNASSTMTLTYYPATTVFVVNPGGLSVTAYTDSTHTKIATPLSAIDIPLPDEAPFGDTVFVGVITSDGFSG